MIRVAGGLLVATLLVALSRPAVARACSCAPPGFGLAVMPAEGMYAPRNTRIWVAHGPMVTPKAGLDVVLLDARGAIVPTDRSEIASGSAEWIGIVVLTPRAPLAANAAFAIQLQDVNGTVITKHFFTDDAVDFERPPVPRVVDVDIDRGDSSGNPVSCSDEGWLGLRMSADAWIVKRDPASATFVSFDPEHLSGVLEDFAAHTDGDATLSYGGGACNAAPWHGFPAEMQFATLDLAGNFSGWSDTHRFAPESTAAACSLTEPGSEPPFSAAAGAWIAAGAVLLRRRSRRREV